MPGPAGDGVRALWTDGPVALPVGVGAWAWGDRGYWGYGRDYDLIDVAAAYRSSRAAGVRLVDTAEVYGRGTSERLLGSFLRDDPDGAEVVVATKFAPLPWRAGRRGPLTAALESSLGRLRLPRVDLYQLHFPLPVVSNRPWLRDLADARQRGLVGGVGVSNYSVRDLRAAHRVLADLGVPLATNQVEYSLLQRKPERTGLVEVCRELDVTIIAYSPLAQGMLTGKYDRQHPPSGVRGLRYRRILDRLPRLVAQLTEIGRGHGDKTPTQVALNWLISHGTVPIPGAKNADQARHNAAGAGWSLTPDEVRTLDALAL